ncbi:MAG: DUF5990 family protein [Asticcacaulis sp.]
MKLRLTIDDPVPGVLYSLQDKGSMPVGPVRAGVAPLSFDVDVTLKDGKLGGPFVRREGKERRFVYIALGRSAGDPGEAALNRRAKIDVHDIPADLLDAAALLECHLPGRGKDGTPACATVRTKDGWRRIT